ncbi:MAG: hypothetical protein GY701_28745 [Sulfitobacter sp.]|nr:hypothetical protein [Sulfitobacter sp.]
MADQSVSIPMDPVVDPAADQLAGRDPVEEAGGRPLPPEKGGEENLLLGKFKSPEDLAKAYQELEKKLGSPPQAPPAEGEKPTSFQIDPDGPTETESGAPQVDIDKYTDELAKDGKLSEQSLTELKDLGFSEQFVEQHLQGQVALREKHEERLNTILGDRNYDHISAWARKTLGPEQLDTFNETMEDGSPTQIEFALQGLIAQYDGTTVGRRPLVEGDALGGSVYQPFDSPDQMRIAMNERLPDGSLRYEQDASYRDEIRQRIAVTP